MSEIIFSNETVQCINIASSVSKAKIRDCLIEEDRVVFVVEKGQLGLAIGLQAKNLERLRNMFKKTVKMVEYNEDINKFIVNLCKPYKVLKVDLEENDEKFVARVSVERSDKSKLIGKNGRNINLIRQLAQRHHPIRDVQIH